MYLKLKINKKDKNKTCCYFHIIILYGFAIYMYILFTGCYHFATICTILIFNNSGS